MSDNAEAEADEEPEEDVADAAADDAGTETEDVDAEAEDAEESEETTDGFDEGDFVEVDYTARTVENDQLVDTTDQEVAEEEGVGEDQEFGPRTIVLGQGHIFDPVEEAIEGTEVGATGSVVVDAPQAFGEYDQDQVQTVSADKIPEDDRYPGARVDVDGQHGHLETIIGGRARVDFNHPLAGEAVEYEYEVVGEVESREERAQGLLEMLLDIELDVWFETETEEEERVVEPDEDVDEADVDEDDADEVEEAADEVEDIDGDEEEADADDEEEPDEPETEVVEVEKESLYVEAVPQLTMNQQWMMGKQQIAQQLIDLLDVDRVIIQETLDGMGGLGMPGMMGGGAGGGGLEEALEDADVDAEELADELEGAQE